MKKMMFVVPIIVIAAMGFRSSAESTAVVENRSGVDIYLMSKPSKSYEVIESGKVIVLANCNEIINKAVKKAAGDKADGVIIYWESGRYDSIKYK